MKSLLFVGCLLIVADMIRAQPPPDVAEVLREQIDACAAEHNIPADEMPKFDETELEGDDKKKIGCFKLCIMKRAGLYDGESIDGDKYEQLAQQIFKGDEEKVAKSMEYMLACVDEVKEIPDECEAAYEFLRCVTLKQNA